MRLVRLFGLSLVVMCVMGVAAATASAEAPEITAGLPAAFTATSGEGVLESENAKSKVECSSDEAAGEFTKAGGILTEIKVHFGGCKSNGLECHTEGDLEKLILFTADLHLADIKIAGVLTLILAVILLKPIVLTCGGVTTVTITGAVLGRVSGVTSGVSTKTGTVTFKQEKGKQDTTTCELDKAFCEKGPYSLSANFGKKVEGAGELTTEAISFPTGITIVW